MAGLKPILLVEDNPNDIELTMAALESSQLERFRFELNRPVGVHVGLLG